jgi:predicted RNase H-like nuclease
VAKSTKLWPGKGLSERKRLLVKNFRKLYAGLRQEICELPDDLLPSDLCEGSLNRLKRYEDALDALVCAWTGSRYLEGCATPYGDDKAAIWVPLQGTQTLV